MITLIHSDHRMNDRCKIHINEDLNVDSAEGDCEVGWEDVEELDDYEDIYLSKEVFSTSDDLKYMLLIEAINMYEACGEEGTYKEEGDEIIPEWVVSLFVVPVSVSRDTAFECLGCREDDEMWKWFQETFDKYGDYRALAFDIHRYGYHIQIWQGSAFSGEDKKELLEAVNRAKKQALPIETMFGFYMDRPLNALGWNGWTIFKQAEAFPGQKIDTSDKEYEIRKCDCCWDEGKKCKPYKTIYEPEQWMCDNCLNTWVNCTKCGILIPAAPQSWSGVDWIEINHQKYCSDCLVSLINSKEFPHIKGGSDLTVEEIGNSTINLAPIQPDEDTFDGWELVLKESVRLGDSDRDLANRIAGTIKEGKGHNFIVAYIWRHQFEVGIGLYRH